MKMECNEELFIFTRMIEGDKEAFRFFFEKYYDDLCNLVNFYLHDQAVTEEIVQDIYVYFWEKRQFIQIDTSVKSYLLKASKNKSLNYLRDERIRLNIQDILSKTNMDDFDEISDKTLDAGYLNELINQAVNCLPLKCREIFVLAKKRELSYKEIADHLGISVKTVDNQMGKALKLLREFLRPHYNDIFVFFLFLHTGSFVNPFSGVINRSIQFF